MSESLEKLLRHSLLNNSYDWNATHEQLEDTWKHSYSYLSRLQNSYIDYDELFYSTDNVSGHSKDTSGHFHVDNKNRTYIEIREELIDMTKRRDYKESKFFKKEFTFMDMVENPELFIRYPIMTIDNQIIWNYTVFTKPDITTITFPTLDKHFTLKYTRDDEKDKIIYNEHTCQVMMVENTYYERIRVELPGFYYGNRLHISSSNLINVPNASGLLFVTVHPVENEVIEELGTNLIPLTYNASTGYFDSDPLDGVTQDKLDGVEDAYMSFVFIAHLHRHTMYNRTDGMIGIEAGETEAPLMVFEEDVSTHKAYQHPIPVANCMIFKRTEESDQFLIQDHNAMIESFYPNIYQLIDPNMSATDEYKVFYFYYEKATDCAYRNIFDFYYRYLQLAFPDESTEEFCNEIYFNRYPSEIGSPDLRPEGTMSMSFFPADKDDIYVDLGELQQEFQEYFEKLAEERRLPFIYKFKEIMHYNVYDHLYGEYDYEYRYKKLPENIDKSPTEYQEETLREWTHVEPWVLNDYVVRQKKLGITYFLYTNQIDLSERYRTDTSQEFPHSAIVFEEPMYVFALANDHKRGRDLPVRFFVDGIFVENIYQRRKRYMDYLYIPVRMVTDDSYLEIEILPEYTYSQKLTFTNKEESVEVKLDPEDVIFPTWADTYAVDDDGNRYDGHLYKYVEHYKGYDKRDLQIRQYNRDYKVKYARLKEFTLSANNEALLNKELTFTINKRAHVYKYIVEDSEKRPYIQFIDTELDWRFDVQYLRIFINGRLVPRSHYMLQTNFKNPRLLFFKTYSAGAIITIDILPYQYKEVYYQKDIELTKGQIRINLAGHIDKPFNIRYFEVYMNGRRLSLNSVFAVSPYEITLVNLKSFHNLLIVERERDFEWYGLDYTKKIYPFTMSELLDSFFITDEQVRTLIKDIVMNSKDSRLTINQNVDEEEVQEYDLSECTTTIENMLFYWDEFIFRRYANGDERQYVGDYIRETYKPIGEHYIKSPYTTAWDNISRDRRYRHPDVLLLNADIIIAGSKPLPFERKEGHLLLSFSKTEKREIRVELQDMKLQREYRTQFDGMSYEDRIPKEKEPDIPDPIPDPHHIIPAEREEGHALMQFSNNETQDVHIELQDLQLQREYRNRYEGITYGYIPDNGDDDKEDDPKPILISTIGYLNEPSQEILEDRIVIPEYTDNWVDIPLYDE